MSLDAVYASTSSFTVSTDKTADFIPGRAVLCDCGSDGLKYSYVSYSSYAAPDTTVVLDTTEGQSITSNIATVNWAREKFTKSSPLELQWLIRGLQTVAVTYKDADEITLKPGVIYIDDGTTKALYRCDGFDKQLTGLSTSTWYYIYAQPPTNGRRITASEITYVTTAPTLNSSKQGYYHPSNANQRCIGFVYSDGSSAIMEFYLQGNLYIYGTVAWDDNETNNPSNTWTDATLTVPAVEGWLALVGVRTYYVNASTYLLARKNGSSGTGHKLADVSNTSPYTFSHGTTFVPYDVSGKIEIKWNASTTNTVGVDTRGVVMASEIFSAGSGGGAQATPTFHTASRGLQSISYSYKDADEIYVNAGAIHIWSGTKEDIFFLNAQVTKQLTSLSASTWYAIYIAQPASGNVLGTGDISYSTTMPTYDDTKMGWYNTSNQRCIGFVRANSSSNIMPFVVANGIWQSLDDTVAQDMTGVTPSNTWTTYTLTVPIGSVAAYGRLTPLYSNVDTTIQFRGATSLSGTSFELAQVTTGVPRQDQMVILPTDASKQIQMRYAAATTNSIWLYTYGFVYPNNLYTGPAGGLARQISGGGLSTKDVGHKNGCAVRWASATSFTVDSGSIHMQDGANQGMYDIPSQLTKSGLGSLSTAWYAVYAQPPTSGYTLTATEITYETTMPTYDQTKRGWYHPTSTTKRCIGFFYASGASTIVPWRVENKRYLLDEDNNLTVVNAVAPSNTWTDATFTVPLGNSIAICKFVAVYVNTANSFQIRVNGGAGAGLTLLNIYSGLTLFTHRDVLLDANKILEYRYSSSCANTVYIELSGFVLPEGI